MKARFTISAIFAMALVFASNTYAATITTGGLTYDDSTHVITGTDGTSYLSWDRDTRLTLAQTFEATAVGGVYEAYHIASETEAYAFFDLATTPANFGPFHYTFTSTRSPDADPVGGIFGDSYDATVNSETAYFLSDSDGWSGSIDFNHFYGYAEKSSSLLPLSYMDEQMQRQADNGYHTNWLLVSDTKLIATPIPAALFMFAPALLGFFGFRRKMQA